MRIYFATILVISTFLCFSQAHAEDPIPAEIFFGTGTARVPISQLTNPNQINMLRKYRAAINERAKPSTQTVYAKLGRKSRMQGTQVIQETPIKVEIEFLPPQQRCLIADPTACGINPAQIKHTTWVRRVYRIVDRDQYVSFHRNITSWPAIITGINMIKHGGAGLFLGGLIANDLVEDAGEAAERHPRKFSKNERDVYWYTLPDPDLQ